MKKATQIGDTVEYAASKRHGTQKLFKLSPPMVTDAGKVSYVAAIETSSKHPVNGMWIKQVQLIPTTPKGIPNKGLFEVSGGYAIEEQLGSVFERLGYELEAQ